MSATDTILGADEVRIEESGTGSIRLRLPWYRSLAPSTIENATITVDGEKVPRESLTIEINGEAADLPTIAERWQETWFVQDRAILRFPASFLTGDSAEIAASLTLRIPYILTGPDSALSRTVHESRTLNVVTEDQK
ncbi:hypothetical protein KEC56_04980 [Microbacterium sp. YMB-B2]|uniref:C-deglycosylation enzyme beta subunit n=1 Tax=Microbacterium tenebrionis TaxID=2830665 RepID=A0A9X1LNJ3_9MICO|nr:DUF6379 domain-containing protein [Microbacterium tenebrionis]MCC2028877.1 hypothetical protein [Microbacterium tenebrionis]